MRDTIESNPQYRFANEHGANATEVTAFGNYPPTGGHKIQKTMSDKEKMAYYWEEKQKRWEAIERLEEQGIDMYRNLNDR